MGPTLKIVGDNKQVDLEQEYNDFFFTERSGPGSSPPCSASSGVVAIYCLLVFIYERRHQMCRIIHLPEFCGKPIRRWSVNRWQCKFVVSLQRNNKRTNVTPVI
jgi:hypothetical protein